MRTPVFQLTAKGLLLVALLAALHLLIRGHDHPGGGFIAGMVTAVALVLEALAFGARTTERRLSPFARPTLGVGLLLALAASSMSLLRGDPFFTQYHGHVPLPGGADVPLSTTLVFEFGIYLVVVGVAATLLVQLSRGVR
jgi:multisubunit Na+/H+ antiporter MnhB subunit